MAPPVSWQKGVTDTLEKISLKLDLLTGKQSNDVLALSERVTKVETSIPKDATSRLSSVESRVNMALMIAGAIGLAVLGVILKMVFKT